MFQMSTRRYSRWTPWLRWCNSTMRQFTFRFDQIVRWRESQVDLRRSRLAAVASRADAVQKAIDEQRAGATRESAAIVESATGESLEWYAAFSKRTQNRILSLQKNVEDTGRLLAAEMRGAVEANRALQLLENLREKEHERWHQENDRETAASAAEAFLQGKFYGAGYNRKKRARSSGG